jgi:hypothetical protein
MIPAAMATAAATRRGGSAEFVVAGILGLLGLRSLVHWISVEFPAASMVEHVLFALHVTARVGTWFALGVAFVGYALVAEPQSFRWFVVIVLVLAAVQLMTAASLGLGLASRGRSQRRGAAIPSRRGSLRPMEDRGTAPGPHRDEKQGRSDDPRVPQPEAAEVESARLLANEARGELERAGLSVIEIRRLADEFIAHDRGEGLPEFVEWARDRGSRAHDEERRI